ncbi:MAG: DUF5615 family PIN-like protein [Alphaproteobacteria bacterium]|nr:DUF5615 family PIN-like protein [Alphaproteobacteria bacterium]
MRILLDEQLPRRLARHLSGHLARTVQQCGWSGRRNGDLLRRAAADGFDIFLTADHNLSYQQNFSGLSLAIVVLMAPSNALEDLQALVPALLALIANAEPGQLYRVGTP